MSYDILVASASRPHLLYPTLRTLLSNVDIPPARIIVHDDAAFAGKYPAILAAIEAAKSEAHCNARTLVEHNDPPILHGPALYRLLSQCESEYALYTQDDHVVVRALPISDALQVMHAHGFNHVRFNKRDTMPYKETWQGRWYKVPMQFEVIDKFDDGLGNQSRLVTLTISDHWHFQTSLWRVAHIRAVVDWFMNDFRESVSFHEHCEMKINNAMNGNVPRFPPLITMPPSDLPQGRRERDQSTRAKYQRTFIWGGIDEKAYIKHIGGKPEDWALPHPRAEYDGRAHEESA